MLYFIYTTSMLIKTPIVAAFHHGMPKSIITVIFLLTRLSAHETYLVPDLLKKAYGTLENIILIIFCSLRLSGHTPAVALFATNGRYKREAYRGSEFAPRILADEGIQVVMKVL